MVCVYVCTCKSVFACKDVEGMLVEAREHLLRTGALLSLLDPWINLKCQAVLPTIHFPSPSSHILHCCCLDRGLILSDNCFVQIGVVLNTNETAVHVLK